LVRDGASRMRFKESFHRGLSFWSSDLSEDPDSPASRRRGGQGREAPGPTLARRDGGWQFSFLSPLFIEDVAHALRSGQGARMGLQCVSSQRCSKKEAARRRPRV
jgi:hypothetical protein